VNLFMVWFHLTLCSVKIVFNCPYRFADRIFPSLCESRICSTHAFDFRRTKTKAVRLPGKQGWTLGIYRVLSGSMRRDLLFEQMLKGLQVVLVNVGNGPAIEVCLNPME
jgi:hypothetical protein